MGPLGPAPGGNIFRIIRRDVQALAVSAAIGGASNLAMRLVERGNAPPPRRVTD
jgi:hypothetical protein